MELFNFFFTLFGDFDFAVLNSLHEFAKATNGFFTPFMSFISLIGEKGVLIFLLGATLTFFKKTRKIGFAVIIAFAVTAVLNTFVLKNIFERARPFYDQNSVYYSFWQFAGAPFEDGFSFPSGHTAAAAAGMTVLFLFLNKKYSWLFFLYPIIMGISRCYFAVHYPSDVLASFIEGLIIGIGSYYLTKFIFNKFPVFKKSAQQ